MADVLETIDKTETVLIVAAIGVGLYFLYQAGGAFADWIDNLTGASAENTYSNAAGQTLAHPINTLGTIGGGWFDDLFGSKTKTLPSEISSTGYMKLGASGQHWSCTGPQGASNDSCTPVTIDANGNATISGPGVLAVNAN